MKTLKIRNFGWLAPPIAALIALQGCAASDAQSKVSWPAQARAVAARRLLPGRSERPIAFQEEYDPRSRCGPVDRSGRSLTEWRAVTLAADADQAAAPPSSPPADESRAESTAVQRGPRPGFVETLQRDLAEMPGLLWSDTKKVYSDPLNLIFLVGAGGASLALRPEVDDDIEDYYDNHHSLAHDWRDAFGVLGNPGTHFALAGLWYLLGQQTQEAKTYEVGKRMFSALTITGLSTMLLKVSANTESPNGEALAWPSGHVSSTMALATVLNDAYGPLVGAPMFGLTALVGLERLDDREHSFSDLIFGAALGWVVAETVMQEHRPEIFGGQIVPYLNPANGNAGVAWVKTLGL